MEPTRSRTDARNTRAYLREFAIGMGGYLVTLALVVAFVDLRGDSPWRFAWIALPAVPALLVVVAVVRHMHRIDEYQLRRGYEGMAVGFAAAMAAALTLGLLASAGLEGRWVPWAIYGAGMLGWAFSASWQKQRDR